MRVENKTMSAYPLTVASGGPKLQKSAIAEKDCTFDTAPDACHNFVGGLGHPLNAKAIDMDDLVHYIGNWTDLPVVNRTALSGLFTVNTEGWVPMRLPPPPPNATGRELLRRPPHNRHGSGQARSRTEATRGRSMRSTVYAQPPTDDHALLRAAQATPLIFGNVSEWESAVSHSVDRFRAAFRNLRISPIAID
jgi:uncharacterized protein (TIGR03435 family)